jgi:hypothetical protein
VTHIAYKNISIERLKRNAHLGDPGLDESIILKVFSEKK